MTRSQVTPLPPSGLDALASSRRVPGRVSLQLHGLFDAGIPHWFWLAAWTAMVVLPVVVVAFAYEDRDFRRAWAVDVLAPLYGRAAAGTRSRNRRVAAAVAHNIHADHLRESAALLAAVNRQSIAARAAAYVGEGGGSLIAGPYDVMPALADGTHHTTPAPSSSSGGLLGAGGASPAAGTSYGSGSAAGEGWLG